jgi:hypothetical protein
MINEIVSQYNHTWRVFAGIVTDFDENSWFNQGTGSLKPARISLHLLQAVKFYIQDSSTIIFPSGKKFDVKMKLIKDEEIPSQSDILAYINEFRIKTEIWLTEMDFEAENTKFYWAGNTKLGLVLFLLRHTLYHIGELSSLLNESKNGVADDNWVKAL